MPELIGRARAEICPDQSALGTCVATTLAIAALWARCGQRIIVDRG